MDQLERLLSRTNRMLDQTEESGDLRTFFTRSKEVRATLELIGKLMGRFVSRHEVNVNLNLTADLTLDQLEDIALVGHQVREAHGIVDTQAYLVADLQG